ncbi:MAG: CvpA family protein [Chitinophagaceae bacterium]
MIIDLIAFILLVLAIYKGWKKGLVVAVCSVLAVFIGLMAALTFSAKISGYFQSRGEQAAWLPFLVFVLVMVVTMFLVRMLANALQKLLKILCLGTLNRIGGILLFLLGYFAVYSIILFYASGISLISPTMIGNSRTYAYIQPWGPTAVKSIGQCIPWFKGLLDTLRAGFEKMK